MNHAIPVTLVSKGAFLPVKACEGKEYGNCVLSFVRAFIKIVMQQTYENDAQDA